MYGNCKYTIDGKFKCKNKKIEKYKIDGKFKSGKKIEKFAYTEWKYIDCPRPSSSDWWGISRNNYCGSGAQGWAATSPDCESECCEEQFRFWKGETADQRQAIFERGCGGDIWGM